MDEELEKTLANHEERISRLESLLHGKKTLSSKKLSSKEFLLKARPEGDVMKVLCIAYYLERIEGLETFNAKDIETAFRAAKEPIPDNINYKVIKNIEKGFIMEAEQKKNHRKAWSLTNTGEEYVENKTGQG